MHGRLTPRRLADVEVEAERKPAGHSSDRDLSEGHPGDGGDGDPGEQLVELGHHHLRHSRRWVKREGPCTRFIPAEILVLVGGTILPTPAVPTSTY